MGFAAIVLEKHAGRAVQLRHDNAFCAIDNKRTGIGHERNLAHVDFLLLDLFDRGLGSLLIHDRQTHLGAQWSRKCQTALLTFLDVKRRFAQNITYKLQAGILGMTLDWKYALERGLQALALAHVGLCKFLQECCVGIELCCQQIGYGQYARTFGKALTDALLFSERVAH